MINWSPALIEADAAAPDATNSTALTDVKARIAYLLQTALGYRGLRAFATPPGAIGQVPVALVYLAPGGATWIGQSSSAGPELETDSEWDAVIEIALIAGPIAQDPSTLGPQAEAWIDLVLRALNKNFTLGNAVWNTQPTHFTTQPIKFGGDPAAPPEWYGPIFQVGVTLLYTYPRTA